MTSALMAEDRLYTYADYKNWELPDGERYELIDGVAYAMAAPSAYHQEILMELSRQFANHLYGKPCKVYAAPYDVRLFYEIDETDKTVVQPDLAVVCNKQKRGKEGCRGAPELVVEILSPSNTVLDMSRKFDLYRRAGVKEYWVIDPESKMAVVNYFSEKELLTRFFGKNDASVKVPVETLPGLEIDLAAAFAE